MSVADITTLQKSMIEQDSMKPFVEKQMLFINDTNNGSYNGSIQFDTTVLSNSGRYLDYSEATLQIPLVLALRSAGNMASAAHAYMCGLKSGYHQLIDSIQVDYQNKNTVQQQAFTNFYVSYKIHSEWSADDLQKYGDLTGVWPDSPASMVRADTSVTPNGRGNGISNNSPYVLATKTYTTGVPLQQINEGLQRRLENTAQNVSGYSGLNSTVGVDNLNTIGKTYFAASADADAAKIYSWYVIATIRLKDLCDFYDKIPLLKGAQIRMTINYNSCRVAVNSVLTGGNSLGLTSVTMLSGRTVPFMICDATANAPGAALTTGAGAGVAVTAEFNVRSTTTPASTNPLLTSCQLFVPAYTLSPEVEAKYLSNPIKNIVYDDIYQYTVSGIAPAGQFNTILTNGILNPKKLILIPFIQAGNTAADRNGCAVDQFRSPFDSAPATTAPLVGLSSLQVQVSGKNMWDHPVRYDFENFQAEVSESGINGGQVTGLSSGLISYKMWQYGYRYYVCDISRRLSASDNIPLAIQISGQNSSGATIDLYAFVTYERSLQVETASGVVVQ